MSKQSTSAVRVAISAALAQLEVAERDLAAQHAATGAELEATRAAIATMRKVADGAPAPGRRVTPRAFPKTAALRSGKPGMAAAAARTRALLNLIAAGTQTTAGLRTALTPDAGVTAEQHKACIANALNRMTTRGLVGKNAGGLVVTAAGRRAAASAAKEAP